MSFFIYEMQTERKFPVNVGDLLFYVHFFFHLLFWNYLWLELGIALWFLGTEYHGSFLMEPAIPRVSDLGKCIINTRLTEPVSEYRFLRFLPLVNLSITVTLLMEPAIPRVSALGKRIISTHLMEPVLIPIPRVPSLGKSEYHGYPFNGTGDSSGFLNW